MEDNTLQHGLTQIKSSVRKFICRNVPHGWKYADYPTRNLQFHTDIGLYINMTRWISWSISATKTTRLLDGKTALILQRPWETSTCSRQVARKWPFDREMMDKTPSRTSCDTTPIRMLANVQPATNVICRTSRTLKGSGEEKWLTTETIYRW